jgi:hypothetical protein
MAAEPGGDEQATRALRRLHAIARKVGKVDACGDALGLWIVETQARLRVARH